MAAISSPTAKSGQSADGPVSAGPEGALISVVPTPLLNFPEAAVRPNQIGFLT